MFAGLKLKQEILLCESLFYSKSTWNENNSSENIIWLLMLIHNREMLIHFANITWTFLLFISPVSYPFLE
jgi:hypothetical protein